MRRYFFLIRTGRRKPRNCQAVARPAAEAPANSAAARPSEVSALSAAVPPRG